MEWQADSRCSPVGSTCALNEMRDRQSPSIPVRFLGNRLDLSSRRSPWFAVPTVARSFFWCPTA